MAERDQALIEGDIARSGWSYRTARIPGHLDFVSPGGDVQSVQAAGGAIVEIRPLHDPEDRQVLVLTERTERVYCRGSDDVWFEDAMRTRS
jgi:hypothetical protein